MTYIIPTWDIAIDAKRDFRNATIGALIYRAESLKIRKDRSELNVRELTLSDLGLKLWVTPKQEAKTTSTWINHQTDYDKVIALYKVAQLSETPGITEISIHLTKDSVYQHQLGQLYGLVPMLRKIKEVDELGLLQVQYGLENLRMEGYFSEPYVISPSQLIKIDVTTGSKGTDGDNLVFVGFVVEPVR